MVFERNCTCVDPAFRNHFVATDFFQAVSSDGGDGMKRIGFIGAGKVGTALGVYFSRKNYPVSGYLSRTRDHAKTSAELVGASVYEELEDIAKDSDILFLTVPDASIREVSEELASSGADLTHKWIIHTSGALSSEIFPDFHIAYGFCLHPAMAVSDPFKAADDFPSTVFTIEGAPKGAEEFFKEAGLHTLSIGTSDKSLYHLACVVASNFVTGLFSWSVDLLTRTGFTEEEAQKIITPLFLANASSVAKNGPVEALTGPVERADSDTIQRHLKSLNDLGDETLYRLISDKLIKIAKEKNPSRDYSKLEELLWR